MDKEIIAVKAKMRRSDIWLAWVGHNLDHIMEYIETRYLQFVDPSTAKEIPISSIKQMEEYAIGERWILQMREKERYKGNPPFIPGFTAYCLGKFEERE